MATAERLLKDGACSPGCLLAYGPCASVPARRRRRRRRVNPKKPPCTCECKGAWHGAMAELWVPGSERYRSPAPVERVDEPGFWEAAVPGATHRYIADPWARPDAQGRPPCMPPCCLPEGHAVHHQPVGVLAAAGRGEGR